MKECGWIIILCLTGIMGFLTAAAEESKTDSSDKGYLEDPNMVLSPEQKAAQQAATATDASGITSKPSPTGSGVWYVRDKVEPVTYPPFEGERYPARIPATLDLAERGAMAAHALTSCVNRAFDCEIYGWKGHIKDGRLVMGHTYNDYNGGQAKWMLDLPLVRTMSGSIENLDVDKIQMETMFRMIGEDGIYYIPVKGAPWHEAFDSAWACKPGMEQHFDSWPAGRALQCLAAWYARNPGDTALKSNIERMIDGFLKIATWKDGACWVPSHFTNGEAPKESPCPVHGVTAMSTLLPGVAQYYRMTHYEPARKLAEGLVKYWLGPSQVFESNGEWNHEVTLHFHGTTFAISGLVDWAEASGDKELLVKMARAYEWARAAGNPIAGWFPEGNPAGHQGTEPCGIGDMTVLAVRLSQLGAGDYWEDAERYARNLLSEVQNTDTWYLQAMSGELVNPLPEEKIIKRPLETDERAAERMRGCIAGMSAFGGQFQGVASHCCTGNATRGMYHAWAGILSEKNGELRVNLLLNRASQWADVNSYLPFQGQVDVIVKKDERLFVRIPSWVTDSTSVVCTVDGKTRQCVMQGRYLEAGSVKAGQSVSVKFPLKVETVKTSISWNNASGGKSEQVYTLRLRGFNVVDLWPRRPDIIHHFFSNPAYREDQVVWKEVERFAPAHEGWW